MVGLIDGLVGGLEVCLRACLEQVLRRKAVAVRHALLCGVWGLVWVAGSDVISLDNNQKHLYITTMIEVMVSEVT